METDNERPIPSPERRAFPTMLECLWPPESGDVTRIEPAEPDDQSAKRHQNRLPSRLGSLLKTSLDEKGRALYRACSYAACHIVYEVLIMYALDSKSKSISKGF